MPLRNFQLLRKVSKRKKKPPRKSAMLKKKKLRPTKMKKTKTVTLLRSILTLTPKKIKVETKMMPMEFKTTMTTCKRSALEPIINTF